MYQKLCVGEITNTHGIRGEVKVIPLTDDVSAFDNIKKVSIDNKEYEIESYREHKNVLLVKFRGYDDINLVERYHSCELFIREDERVNELELDEYYHSDLIGKEVYNQHGKARGYVKEVKELPQCDYLFVNYNGKNYYIPFMKKFIISVSDKIVINELEGLFNED